MHFDCSLKIPWILPFQSPYKFLEKLALFSLMHAGFSSSEFYKKPSSLSPLREILV